MATQRKDGRWQATKRIGGERITVYGRTAKEADARLSEALAAPIVSTSPQTALHEAAIALWWPRVELLAHNTSTRYASAYRAWVAPRLGSRAVATITPSECQAVITAGIEAGRKHKTLELVKSVMLQVFDACEAEGLIDRNPARRVRLPAAEEKRVRVLEAEQAAQLLAAVEGSRLSAPVFLAVVLGLRRGEAAGLHWSDLDRQRGTLMIQRQRVLQRYGKASGRPPEVVEKALKTKSSRRTLLLTPGMIAEIDRRGDLDAQHICTMSPGRPWLPDTLTEEWESRRAGLGLQEWSFHDLRHGAAGLLYAAGCDPILIAAVLGHQRPDMSLIYTDASDTRRKEALSSLSEHLGFGRQS